MSTRDELLQDLFVNTVTFKNGFAKWENYKHPDNPDFCQPVFWIAFKAGDYLIVKYSLGTDTDSKALAKVHKYIPIGDNYWEDVLFDYWKS